MTAGNKIETHCWNTVGTCGDVSCGELKNYLLCRRCPVHAAAAATVLEAPPPVEYIREWSVHVAEPRLADGRRSQAVVIFSAADEWLGVPASIVVEVAALPPIHSIPRRRGGAVLGVANVRGELLVCAALWRLLGRGEPESGSYLESCRRLLVLQRNDTRVACPVTDVHGIHRFHTDDLRPLPATLANLAARISSGVLDWSERSVGVLDDEALFSSLKRSLD